MKDGRFIFWKIANGFIFMPKKDESFLCNDDEVYVFPTLKSLFTHIEKVYSPEKIEAKEKK